MTAEAKFPFRPKPVGNHGRAVQVDVARTLDEIMAALSVRSVVFVGEQRCPHDEEFDGNDFAGSTHLLARVQGEPAGTLRLRWFADFAKLERVAVKREHRGSAVTSVLIMAGMELVRRKGYCKMLGHVQVRLISFWERFGFRIRQGHARFVFSDYEYVEMERDLEPAANSLHLDTDPLILIRPEGQWDEPGVLDLSASRGGAKDEGR